MRIKNLYYSVLTLSFWMIASLGIMQHTKAYFTPEIISFFDGSHLSFDMEKLFEITLYSFLVGMLIAFISVRYVAHRILLCTGLIMCVCALILGYIFMTLHVLNAVFISVAFVGLACGFLPVSGVCSVMKHLTLKIKSSSNQIFHVMAGPQFAKKLSVPSNKETKIEVVSNLQEISDEENLVGDDEVQLEKKTLVPDEKNKAKQTINLLNPMGLYLILPIMTGVAILAKHSLGVVFAVAIFFLSVFFALIKSKDFGNFTSRPSIKLIVKTLTTNYMLYILLVLFIIVSCVDVISIYYLPYLLENYISQKDIVHIMPLIMLLLFLFRIVMIIFAELSLVQVPARRLVLFSHVAIAIGIVFMAFAAQEQGKIILLFAISSSLSVVFPSVVKGIARFLPFAILPLALVMLATMGAITMFISYAYIFPYISNINAFTHFYILAAILLVIISVLFFILSYKRSLIKK